MVRSATPVFLALFALVFASCAGNGGIDPGRVDSDAGPPVRLDGAPDAPTSTRPADPPGEETYDYVVRILETGDRDPGEMVAPGFNLDGLISSARDREGCMQADWTAPPAYGGYLGVDNQLPLILDAVREMDPDGVPNDVDMQLRGEVDSGQVVLLFRLSRVGSLENDGLVNLALYIGLPWSGASPPEKEMVIFEGETRLAHRGGQTFVVDPESVIDGDLSMPRTIFRDAWIEEGRIYTSPEAFSIRLSVQRDFVIELDEARAEAFVSADRLTSLVIGGRATKDEIFRTLSTFDPTFLMDYGPLATVVLESIADIDADESEIGCEAISLSLVGDAVDAVIEPPP